MDVSKHYQALQNVQMEQEYYDVLNDKSIMKKSTKMLTLNIKAKQEAAIHGIQFQNYYTSAISIQVKSNNEWINIVSHYKLMEHSYAEDNATDWFNLRLPRIELAKSVSLQLTLHCDHGMWEKVRSVF